MPSIPILRYRFLVLIFLWLFFWEAGGQNIPNDWADIEEDTALKASTIPVRFGTAVTVRVIFICLVLTVCLGCMTIAFSNLPNLWVYTAASVGVGLYFLLLPALNLYVTRDRNAALALFNRASYYPAAMLAVIIVVSIL